MEDSAGGQQTLERWLTKFRVIASILVGFGIIALALGIACAGSPADKLEAEWPRGGVPQIPGVKGNIELMLSNSSTGGTFFRASGRAKGKGLIENAVYSMWVANPDGSLLLLDSAPAREECDQDSTGNEDCEVELFLRSELNRVPFDVTSLQGLTVSISEDPGSSPISLADLEGRVVLEFNITEADL